MKTIIVKDYDELSNLTSSIIIKELKKNPKLVLGLATGSTPIGTYKCLSEAYNAKEISFKDVSTFNLDEYVGLDSSNNQSYRFYMNHNLFDNVDINKNNVHFPTLDVDVYDNLLDQNPRDIQILGLGPNGHIGFNEPGTSFESRTHITELQEKTRIANSRFFKSMNDVPTEAVTMGIKDIMKARRIIVLASDSTKKEVVQKLIEGNISIDFPASILNKHSDCTLIVTEDAIK
jgi:glucosamine-6-phosphate deaminase